MEVPAGFQNSKNPNLVCRLCKSFYGLKQAPRQWYAKIHQFLSSELNFVSSPHEPCLYILRSYGILLVIILYVDDLLIAGNDHSELLRVNRYVSQRFKMKDLGQVKECLGIQVSRDRASRTLHISQTS